MQVDVRSFADVTRKHAADQAADGTAASVSSTTRPATAFAEQTLGCSRRGPRVTGRAVELDRGSPRWMANQRGVSNRGRVVVPPSTWPGSIPEPRGCTSNVPPSKPLAGGTLSIAWRGFVVANRFTRNRARKSLLNPSFDIQVKAATNLRFAEVRYATALRRSLSRCFNARRIVRRRNEIDGGSSSITQVAFSVLRKRLF